MRLTVPVIATRLCSLNNFLLTLTLVLALAASIKSIASPKQTLTEDRNNLTLDNANDRQTSGRFLFDNNVLKFDCKQVNEGVYEFVVDTQGKRILLRPDANSQTLSIEADNVVLTLKDTQLFAEAAKQIASSMAPDKTAMKHNSLLIGMLEYLSEAPDGHLIKSSDGIH